MSEVPVLYANDALIKNLQTQLEQRADPKTKDLFDAGFICDWNTCDWFCVKVLGPLAEQQDEGCAQAICRLAGCKDVFEAGVS